MRTLKYWIIASLVFGLSPFALARNVKSEDIVKHARKEDRFACQYLLNRDESHFSANSHMLYRADCDKSGHPVNPKFLARNVVDFKISQHPLDLSLAYFVKEEHGRTDLWHISSQNGETKRLTEDLKKIQGHLRYNVIPKTDTTIVMISLSNDGTLRAWDNERVVHESLLIDDYKLNPNFGKAGQPFSSYVAFAIDKAGYIIKIKGKDPENSKAETTKTFASIQDFIKINKIDRSEL